MNTWYRTLLTVDMSMSPMFGTRLVLSGEPSSSHTEDRSTTGFACISVGTSTDNAYNIKGLLYHVIALERYQVSWGAVEYHTSAKQRATPRNRDTDQTCTTRALSGGGIEFRKANTPK